MSFDYRWPNISLLNPIKRYSFDFLSYNNFFFISCHAKNIYVILTIYHVVRMTHYLMRTRLYVMCALRVMGYAQDNASCTKVISRAYEILYSANNIKCYIHKVLWHYFMRTKSGRAYKIYITCVINILWYALDYMSCTLDDIW